MPPRRGRQGRGGQNAQPGEAASGVRGGRNQGAVPNPGAPVLPVNFAREIAAAIVEATRAVPPANVANRAFEAMREFRRAGPPQFDGEGEPLAANHWLTEIRKTFDTLRIVEEDLRVDLAAYQLTGEASEWWTSLMEARRDARRAAMPAHQQAGPEPRDNMTWVEFEHIFEDQYFPESYREELREQFERLEQGAMTVSQYASRFQTLSRFAPDLVANEARKCKRFERGLASSVKRLVMSQQIRDFAHIVECARNIEPKKEAVREVKVWEPRQQSISTSSSSGGSGSYGRKRQRDKPQSHQGRQGSRLRQPASALGVSVRAEIVCHKCGQKGHYRSQCGQKQQQPRQAAPRACFTCGLQGHFAKECSQGGGDHSEFGTVQQQLTGPVYGQQYQLPYGPGGSGSGSRGDRTGSSSASGTRGGHAQGPMIHGGA